MEEIRIPYTQTGYYSKLILDYLSKQQSVEEFYHRFPEIDQFEAQIEAKKNSFSNESRKNLVAALEYQYREIQLDAITQQHITQLVLPNTFTITTGHQLNLFSGPLYFVYKIVSVINLCKQLKATYPKHNFVPVFWMATEDHDFEEIHYFNCKGKKVVWDKPSGGPVGRLTTEGMEEVFKELDSLLNSSHNANQLRAIFKKAYCSQHTLADATRILVNELFGKDGLVVMDGDDVTLKKMFKPYVVKELTQQITYQEVNKTSNQLHQKGYQKQVNPREINLFLSGSNFRERLVAKNGGFAVNNTNLFFKDLDELLQQTFGTNQYTISGNALLRPLYQEVILPNLCYVGGAGELAYWLQLKSTFKQMEVPFPMLLLRNAALLITQKQFDKIQKLQLTVAELFLPTSSLIQQKVNQFSQKTINFKEQQAHLEKMFALMRSQVHLTDASFEGAVNAQEKKQIKGLQQLEKRWLKAEKKRLYEEITRIETLQQSLFPNGNLQERVVNFTAYYEAYGTALFEQLFKELNPLAYESFNIVKLP